MAYDVNSILQNLSNQIPILTQTVALFSYIAGIIFIMKALFMMRKFGGQQFMGGQFEIKGPLTYFIVGAVLMSPVNIMEVSLNSFFGQGTDNPFSGGQIDFQNMGQGSDLLGYVSSASISQQWQQMSNSLVLIMQFVGYLSFVRGWFMLAKLGDGQGQQAGFGKGLTHIIGGLVAVNFVGATKILANTLGI